MGMRAGSRICRTHIQNGPAGLASMSIATASMCPLLLALGRPFAFEPRIRLAASAGRAVRPSFIRRRMFCGQSEGKICHHNQADLFIVK